MKYPVVLLLIVALVCNWQVMFHRPLRVITTMLLLTSVLVLYQFYVLAQATEWSHILSISILLFSNYYTLFKLTRDRIVLGRAYKEESAVLWLRAYCIELLTVKLFVDVQPLSHVWHVPMFYTVVVIVVVLWCRWYLVLALCEFALIGCQH